MLRRFLLILLFAQKVFAAEEPKQSQEVQIEFDEQSEVPEEHAFPGIERMFKNPALANGIASGTDALNHSIDSLMESVFYSLLNQDLVYQANDQFFFSFSTHRDVYTTGMGAYVVADRINLGPGSNFPVANIHDVNINFGAESGAEILDIYFTTDGKRVAEKEDLPLFRQWANNWFGLLPILTSVLPPSFNSNQLYDPFHLLGTPFRYPSTVSAFHEMPIGSIRSFALSGGIHYGVDLVSGVLDQDAKKLLAKLNNLGAVMPYTVFERGEHRINVLRRGQEEAWVGVANLEQTGHSLTPLFGSPMYLLSGTVPKWKGFKGNFFPIDVELQQALVKKSDQAFRYDMGIEDAQKAYLAAVKGDFAPSLALVEDGKMGKKTGVDFLYKTTQKGPETELRNGQNIALMRNVRTTRDSRAEVRVTDPKGTYDMLQSVHNQDDEHWDILVGSAETKVEHRAELKVNRVDDPAESVLLGDPGYHYVFTRDNSPVGISVQMDIQDKYVDVEDYRAYLELLRFASDLPIADVPNFPVRENDRESLRERRTYFIDPKDLARNIHVMPIHLGKFNAHFAAHFSTDEIHEIVRRPEDEGWRAFAEAFGAQREDWQSPNYRKSFAMQSEWLTSFFLYPFRLLNLRFARVDAIKEASERLAALQALRNVKDPQQMVEKFSDLFDTDYAMQLTKAMILLSHRDRVPRKVILYTKPQNDAPFWMREAFQKLNNKTFQTAAKFPANDRYNLHLEQSREFTSSSVFERRPKPQILQIVVHKKPSDGSTTEEIFVEVASKKAVEDSKNQVYARVEQAGRLKFGKLVLAEKVFSPSPLPQRRVNLTRQNCGFYVSGPQTALPGYFLRKALEFGGDFTVYLATSDDGIVFSEERSLTFHWEDGLLSRVQ